MLDYVQSNSKALFEQFRKDVETVVREGKLGYQESGRLLQFDRDGLHGYTYLEEVTEGSAGLLPEFPRRVHGWLLGRADFL